jgi:uncharacterized membrane protein
MKPLPRPRFLLTGILTAIPLIVTWWVFDFVLDLLSRAGAPWAKTFVAAVRRVAPDAATWLEHPSFYYLLSVMVTLGAFYLLGWFTSRVVGSRILAGFDQLMTRLPMIKSVYGATRQLVQTLRAKPSGVQRVVLIDFPSPEMKTVGFVTRTLKDASSGDTLAAVYVPTTPNPTSGYMEIVPLSRLTPTDWSMEEAMTFIVSGGTMAPERVHYTRGAAQTP